MGIDLKADLADVYSYYIMIILYTSQKSTFLYLSNCTYLKLLTTAEDIVSVEAKPAFLKFPSILSLQSEQFSLKSGRRKKCIMTLFEIHK